MQQPADDKKKGKYRYLAGNIVLFSISNFVSKILVFLLVPFYTNILTPSDYGIADIMQTTLLLLVPALTINIGEAALRFGIDRSDKRKDIFRTGLKFVALASLTVAVCCGIGCLFVRRDIKWYLFLFIFLFLTNCCYEFLVLFFQGCEQVGTVVCGSITSTLVLLVSNIIFLLVVKIGLNGYLLSQMLAFTIASMLMLMMGRRRIPGIVTLRTADGTVKTNASKGEGKTTGINLAEGENNNSDKEFEREMISYGLPMIAYSTGSWINNAADRYLVSFIKGVAVNGVYGVAYKIPAILTVFQRIFAQAWQMSATKSYSDDNSKEFFSTMYNMYNTFMVIGCSMLILLVKPAAFLLFKKDFFEAWQYVPPLLISVVFGALTGFLGSICLAYKDSKAMGLATGTGALVNIVLNLILIPKYSAMGAAAATGISYFIMYCLAYKKVSEYVDLKIRRLRDRTAYIFLIIESIIMIVWRGGISATVSEYHGYAICAVIVMLIICMYIKELQKIIASLMSYFIKGKIPAERIAENRITAGNIALMVSVFLLTTADWHFYTWYEFFAPYGTLIAGIGLTVALFCYMDIKDMIRDPAFLLMAGADIVALINLFAVGSDKGAILTVADFLLILYMANKIKLSDKQVIISMCYIGAFFVYWTIDVKGYFKGYNTNYGGLVLISGFFFAVYALEYLKDFLINKKGRIQAKWLTLGTVILFVWGYKIIAWYRSRCAFLGLIAFAVLLIIPVKMWKNRIFYMLVTLGTTAGAVLFSLLYIWLGAMKDTFRIQIFYKDIISGREEVWSVLWRAFLKQPVTGIGSSYDIQLDWLNGMFEVHNGLLDILIVHGIAVFAVTVVLMVKRFLELHEFSVSSPLNRCAMAGVFAMMMPAFMENYIIVAPYSLILLILIGLVRKK